MGWSKRKSMRSNYFRRREHFLALWARIRWFDPALSCDAVMSQSRSSWKYQIDFPRMFVSSSIGCPFHVGSYSFWVDLWFYHYSIWYPQQALLPPQVPCYSLPRLQGLQIGKVGPLQSYTGYQPPRWVHQARLGRYLHHVPPRAHHSSHRGGHPQSLLVRIVPWSSARVVISWPNFPSSSHWIGLRANHQSKSRLPCDCGPSFQSPNQI